MKKFTCTTTICDTIQECSEKINEIEKNVVISKVEITYCNLTKNYFLEVYY